MARTITSADAYRDRLLKLIPSEVIGAYTVIQGIVPSGRDEQRSAAWALTLASAALLALTPVILAKVHKVTSRMQIGATMIAFVIWVYSLGGPFRAWGDVTGRAIYEGWIGSILLVLWTTLAPEFGVATEQG